MKKEWLIGAALLAVVLFSGGLVAVRVFKTRKEFFDGLLPDAKRLQAETGIDPLITLTQAAHESNFGKSELSSKYNNYFGIKPGSSWKGRVANFTTTEYSKGVPYQIKSDFRAYDSPLDSFRDWASLLARLYPQALDAAKRGDIEGFGRGLLNGKAGAYATDPTYGAQLVSVQNAIKALA